MPSKRSKRSKRPRIRKDGLRDNRSRPRLKECPPHEQRYILRQITSRGLGRILKRWPEGKKPTIEELRNFTRRYRILSWRYNLMSTRPRPRLILTCWWEYDEESRGHRFKYRKAR